MYARWTDVYKQDLERKCFHNKSNNNIIMGKVKRRKEKVEVKEETGKRKKCSVPISFVVIHIGWKIVCIGKVKVLFIGM